MSKKFYVNAMKILLVLLLCGTFFDLQISQVLYDPENLFGIFFQKYGQLPAMLSVLIGFLLLVLSIVSEGSRRKALCRTGLILIFTFYIAEKLCRILKNIWGRPRFYSLLEDFSRFSPWYHISGSAADDTFRSFPSGHVTEACMIFSIVLLADLVPQLSEKKTALYVFASAWTACVMLARIVAGAHFLSDVTVGAALTLTVLFVFANIAENK